VCSTEEEGSGCHTHEEWSQSLAEAQDGTVQAKDRAAFLLGGRAGEEAQDVRDVYP
jgi:hypothetical protein